MRNCYRNCKEECNKYKLATCVYYMSKKEYKFKLAIRNSTVCHCGEIMVMARFRGETFKLCTSCNSEAMRIRRLLVG